MNKKELRSNLHRIGENIHIQGLPGEDTDSPFISHDEESVASIYEEIERVLVGCECKFVVSTGHPVQALDSYRLEVACELWPCVVC